MFDAVGFVAAPDRGTSHLPEAVATIVTGQMLSNAAAAAIVKRLFQAGVECGADELFDIPEDKLLSCGLSRRKVRSIKEFGEVYRRTPNKFNEWSCLSYEELRAEVRQHWGLSDWTAEMLAIFHFGNGDVFPRADGTIKRAVCLVQTHLDPDFDPDLARPHRTALARMLWASIDCGYWKALEPT
jgi:DNA-3-methyladenine glycosylase II